MSRFASFGRNKNYGALGQMITQFELKELLYYASDTGVFNWRTNRPHRPEGAVAGSFHSTGYVHISINRKLYKAHRLAWLYVHGSFPLTGIDHINRNKSDNRVCNLRLANQTENNRNTALRKDNTSGVKGVSWSIRAKKWVVQIGSLNGARLQASYTNFEDAVAARQDAERIYGYDQI